MGKKMKIYRVSLVSQINIIISLLLWFVILTPFFFIRIKYLPAQLGTLKAIVIAIPFLLLLFMLFRIFATAKSEWVVTGSSVEIKWSTNFTFVKEKKPYNKLGGSSIV